MKVSYRLFGIFSILLFSAWIGGCAVESTAEPTPTERKKPTFTLVSKYTMPATEGRLTVRFGFTPGYRLWSRGSTDSKKDQIMYSDNFGKSWEFIESPNSCCSPDAILFVDKASGWAIDNWDVMKTEDGGMTWKQVSLPDSHKIAELNAIEFKDPNRGFIAGSTSYISDRGSGTVSFGIEILCTKNSGESWNICYKNKVNNQIWRIFSLGNSTVFLVDQKMLLITNDDGSTWKTKQLDFSAMDIEPDSNRVIWAVGEDGFIRSSRDFGDTWQTVSLKLPFNDPEFSWNSISFDDSGFGVAVGDNGVMAFTTDQGGSWNLQSEIKLKENLWTARVQSPYVAVLGEGDSLYVLRID